MTTSDDPRPAGVGVPAAAPGPTDDPTGGGPVRHGVVRRLTGHDPGHRVRNRALRATIVLPPLFAVLELGLHRPTVALFASFGCMAYLVFADVDGEPRRRLVAFAGLTALSVVALGAGTLVSEHRAAAAVTMFVVAFALQHVSVLGGGIAAVAPAALLAFVLAAMVPASPSQVLAREVGWLLAGAVAVPAAMLAWPPRTLRAVRAGLAGACRALADVARDADPTRTATAPGWAVALDQLAAARDRYLRQPIRPAGPSARAQALLLLVDELTRAGAVLDRVVPAPLDPGPPDLPMAAGDGPGAGPAGSPPLPGEPAIGAHPASVPDALAPATDELREAVVDALTLAAELLERSRHPQRRDEAEQVARAQRRLATARDEHRRALARCAGAELADGAGGEPVLAVIEGSFGLRVLALAASSIAADAAIAVGIDADHAVGRGLVGDDAWDPIDDRAVLPLVPLDGAGAAGTLRRTRFILATHLHPGSVWFRNSLRAAVALTASSLIASSGAFEHQFWIVLGTLSVLRSTASNTGRTTLEAVLGNVVGFAAAAVLLLAGTDRPLVLWLALPAIVFLAAYTPSAVNFVLGQASFCLFVVVLFNLIEPEGVRTGVTRIENVMVGGLVSVVVAFLFWPRGAASALRVALARLFRADARALTVGIDATPTDADELRTRRLARAAVRRQTDEALAQFLGEAGAKPVGIAPWTRLANLGGTERIAAQSLEQLQRTPMRFGGSTSTAASPQDEAVAVLRRAADERSRDLLAVADRLDDPTTPGPDGPGGPGRSDRAGRTVEVSRADVRAALVHALDRASTAAPGHEPGRAPSESILDVARAGAATADGAAEAVLARFGPLVGLVFAAEWLDVTDEVLAEVAEPLVAVQQDAVRPWWR